MCEPVQDQQVCLASPPVYSQPESHEFQLCVPPRLRVAMQRKLADIHCPTRYRIPALSPALLPRADQPLLTHCQQQESDYPRRRSIPEVFLYFGAQIPPCVLQPLKQILKIHTEVAQSLLGPSACSHGCCPTTSESACPKRKASFSSLCFARGISEALLFLTPYTEMVAKSRRFCFLRVTHHSPALASYL